MGTIIHTAGALLWIGSQLYLRTRRNTALWWVAWVGFFVTIGSGMWAVIETDQTTVSVGAQAVLFFKILIVIGSGIAALMGAIASAERRPMMRTVAAVLALTAGALGVVLAVIW